MLIVGNKLSFSFKKLEGQNNTLILIRTEETFSRKYVLAFFIAILSYSAVSLSEGQIIETAVKLQS